MGLRRRLLFGGYRLLRGTGYFAVSARRRPAATVIMLHRVNDHDPSDLTTPTPVFEEMLRVVTTEYRVRSLPDLIGDLRAGRQIEPLTVSITFDDGYRDDLTVAAPLLLKYRVPATFFVVTGHVDTGRPFPWDGGAGSRNPVLTWDEVRELSSLGFDIGAHTVHHVNLGEVGLETARAEVTGSKARIEEILGRETTLFAYPFGGRAFIRGEVRALAREAGFHCCCNGFGGKVLSGSDPFSLDRAPMYRTVTELLMELDNFMVYDEPRQRFRPFGIARDEPVDRRAG